MLVMLGTTCGERRIVILAMSWCSKERIQLLRKCSLSKCEFLSKICKGKIIILYTGCSLIIFLVPFQTWSVPSTLGITSMPQGNSN